MARGCNRCGAPEGNTVVVRDHNEYCSLVCAELDLASRQAQERLSAGGCYACDGTGFHEGIRNTSKPCDYCDGTGKRGRSLEVPQVSVLSAEDRAAIDEARQWFRRLLLGMQDENLPGMEDPRRSHTVRLDGLERAGLYEVLEKLNALAGRHAGEPHLAEGKR